MKIGVVSQNYLQSELDLIKPDLWTLADRMGASIVTGSVRRWFADQAAEHNKKVMMSYTAPPYKKANLTGYWASKEALIEHLKIYDISQYRNHIGVYGHILCGEPMGSEQFDPRNPDGVMLNLIEIIKAGVAYIKSQDPTHPVTVALNNAGTAYEGPNDPDYIEKRRSWIRRFIDHVDILDYHYYYHTFSDIRTFDEDLEKFRTHWIENCNMLVEESQGKPIVIGECGCPSGDYVAWTGKILNFSEEIQKLYFETILPICEERDITTIIFKMIEFNPLFDYGVFRRKITNGVNEPKPVVQTLKFYGFEVPDPYPDPDPIPDPAITPYRGAVIASACGVSQKNLDFIDRFADWCLPYGLHWLYHFLTNPIAVKVGKSSMANIIRLIVSKITEKVRGTFNV